MTKIIIKDGVLDDPLYKLIPYWKTDKIQTPSKTIILRGNTKGDGKRKVFTRGAGVYIDLDNHLVVGKTYLITCLVKTKKIPYGSEFQLWCHDKNIHEDLDALQGIKSVPIIPSINCSQVNIIFHAHLNKNLRIHLHYLPGDNPTSIEVLELKIIELKMN